MFFLFKFNLTKIVACSMVDVISTDRISLNNFNGL